MIGTGLENRLGSVESMLVSISLQLADLTRRVAALEDQKWAGGGSGGFGGGSEGNYACVPQSMTTFPAASGQPGSGTPTSLGGQTIYQMQGGAWVTLPGTARVYNGLFSPVTIGIGCWLAPDGAGNYVVLSQGCT